MPEMTVEQAIEQLRALGGFDDWLLSSTQKFWTAPEVARKLNELGIRVSPDTVARDLTNYPQLGYGKAGQYSTRESVILAVAGRIRLERESA